jgi:uncharacterized protein (DUF362 family)
MSAMERARVALLSSKYYGEESKSTVKRVVELIGGIGKVVRPGDVVLIKPNLINTYDGESGNVTHSSFIEPLVEVCHRAGASKIFVGDGSGDIDTSATFTTSGMKKVVDRLRSDGIPVEFVDLNYDKNPETNEFDTVSLGKDALIPNQTYRVAHTVLISDVIISVPKLKTHALAGISVALKNTVGIAAGGYYGFPKRRENRLPHGDDNNPLANDVIWRMILDLHRIALGRYSDSPKERKYLAVVDGVVAGSYDKVLDLGDQHWLPVWKPVKVGAIIAGIDPVAVDAVSARVMGCRPEKIPTIYHASEIGWGAMNDIEIVGEKVEDVRRFVPLPKGFSSAADVHVPKLWPTISYFTLRTNMRESFNRSKYAIYDFLKKLNLC